MAKKAAGCRKGIVTFKTSRGKVISFPGRWGKSCGPRKAPSTRHLARYKKALGAAARSCKGKSRGAFLKCVAGKTKG